MTDIVERLRERADWDHPTSELTEAANEILSLRSRAEKAEAERDEAIADQQQALDLCAAAVEDYNDALATCEKLAKALDASQDLINRLLHVYVAPDECRSFIKPSRQWFWDNGGTLASIADQSTQNHLALSEYRKEASNANG